MKIGFSVATSDVDTPQLPAQQGEFTKSLDILSEFGYDGVEVSIRQPKSLNLDELRKDVETRGLEVASIHTAAIGFQDKVWLCHPDKSIRDEGMIRLKGALDAAAFFGVEVIIGSFRGQLVDGEKIDDEVQFCLTGAGAMDITAFLGALRKNGLEHMPVFVEVSRHQSSQPDYVPEAAAAFCFEALDNARIQLG